MTSPKTFGVVLCAGVLSACQTPASVRDLGTLTAKYSAQMDSSVTTYVAALNANNVSDASRIQSELADARRQSAANADDSATYKLSGDAQAVEINRVLAAIAAMTVTDPTPILGNSAGTSLAAVQGSKVTFDDSSLKTIESVSGGLAKSKSLSEQASILSAYAQAVEGDLKPPPSAAAK